MSCQSIRLPWLLLHLSGKIICNWDRSSEGFFLRLVNKHVYFTCFVHTSTSVHDAAYIVDLMFVSSVSVVC